MYSKDEILILSDPNINKDVALEKLWFSYKKTIVMKSNRCESRAKITGVLIHSSDFESEFTLALWKSILAFDNHPNYKFSHILYHRLRLSELKVWNNYKVTGNASDKDNQTFIKAIVSDISAENASEFDENNFIMYFATKDDILAYSKSDLLKSQIIYLLYYGYSPKEIVKLVFNTKYTDKYRKKIQRIRNEFKRFLNK